MNTSETYRQIHNALEVLDLPALVTRADVKKRYRQLAQEYHPDRGKSDERMETINAAYALLIEYIDRFRYRFDVEEIAQQYPEEEHAQKFRF